MKFIQILAAAFAAFLPACSIGYRNPCGQVSGYSAGVGYGFGQPGFNQFGGGSQFAGPGGYGPGGPSMQGQPRNYGVQNNGSMAWDKRSSVVRMPQSVNQFGAALPSRFGPTPNGGYMPTGNQAFGGGGPSGPYINTGGNPGGVLNGGYNGGYGQPGYAQQTMAPRMVPSGRTVNCPGCGVPIGNAPSGRFPCQRCGQLVTN